MDKIKTIGIDARFYGPKQKGLGRYVQKLVDNLDTEVGSCFKYQFIIFLRQENWHKYQPHNPNFKKVLADYPWYSFKEQIFMPFKIWQNKIDLMHFPHFNVSIFYFGSFIITIHDLILKRFPTRKSSTLGFFKYWLKNIGYKIVINIAIKKAKKIIAVSDFTKQDILKYFKVKSNKIDVIYEGTPKLRLKPGKSSIKTPYLLYVGNAYPHKNLERLILAFKEINKEKKPLKLILVGELDYFYKRLQRNFARVNNIVFTDFISDEELINLYQNASLYIFPSLCEGFGLPPLEAMAYNLPVVSSNSSCLPEILGDAAIYFNPEDIDDMVDKITKVLDNEKLQEELVLKGEKQIKRYSWEEMAQEILAVYDSVI